MRILPVLVVLVGCGSSPHPGSSTGSSEAPDPNATESSEVAAETTASPEATPEAVPEAGRAEEAAAICEGLVLEDVVACVFRGAGQPLTEGAHVDLLEVEAQDPSRGVMKTLYLVVHTPGDEDLTTTLALGEAYDVPGESLSYEAGAIAVDGDTLSVPFSNIATTYPNTGEPDGPSGEYTERDDMVARCVRDGEFWDCDRTPR